MNLMSRLAVTLKVGLLIYIPKRLAPLSKVCRSLKGLQVWSWMQLPLIQLQILLWILLMSPKGSNHLSKSCSQGMQTEGVPFPSCCLQLLPENAKTQCQCPAC